MSKAGQRVQTLKTVCQAVWRMEAEFGLLDRQVLDVHYWPLVRQTASKFLLRQLRLEQVPEGYKTPTRRAAYHLNSLTSRLHQWPWHKLRPADTVLLPHNRKLLRDGRLYDPLTDAAVTEQEFGQVLVLDLRGPLGNYAETARCMVRERSVMAAIAQLRGRMLRNRFLPQLSEEYRLLNGWFEQEFDLQFPLSPMAMASYVSIFRELRMMMKSVLRKVRAQRLILMNAPGHQAYVAAAQDLGLPAIEFQHSVISRYHLGYSYPGRPRVPYAPDRLLTFGRHWGQSVELAGNTEARTVGSRTLQYYREAGIKKVPRRILVISQGQVGRPLFEMILAAANHAPDWEFVFRTHMNESPAAFQRDLDAGKPANVRLSTVKEDFYALLASSEVQIGVGSTGLFEGTAFGARTILVDLPGIDHMTCMIEAGEAVVARNAADIVRGLSIAPTASPERYYASPVPSVFDVMTAA